MRTPFTLAAVIVIAATAPAAAEVMDKEPTLGAIWASAVVIAVVAFIAGRVNPLLAVVALFASLYAGNVAVYALSEIEDPTVGRAILIEAGPSYIVQTKIACVLELVAAAAGSAAWMWRRWAARIRRQRAATGSGG